MKNQVIQIDKTVTPSKTLTISFINPPHADWGLVNPLTLFCCKSHYDRFGKYKEHVVWEECLYQWNKYQSHEEIYDQLKHCDVIMFSSYFWNYDICDSIAKLAKADGKTTILGGPHIGTNEPALLDSRLSYYDYVCVPTKPGEVFMEDFINAWFEKNGKPEYNDISWEIRSSRKRDYRLDHIDYSVYLDNIDYLRKLIAYAKENKLEPLITIETTRGCPYSCVFCEWGGGTGTKIYKKDIEVIKADVLALKEAGYFSATATDANFGVFEDRDIEILRFAWSHNFNITDISTVKTKDLKRRKRLVDAWFDVIKLKPESELKTIEELDMWNRSRHLSILPTVSIQSVSEEAMRISNRVDLSLEDKIELSRYIGEQTAKFGYPTPALELILAMPGSTIDDFYAEMEIIWNFRCWGLRRHDYMFFPDSDMSSQQYLDKYQIKLKEVYADDADEVSQNFYSAVYKNNKSFFRTIVECYSFTYDEFLEMAFMNLVGSFILRTCYGEYSDIFTPAEFTKTCYAVIKELDGYAEIYNELENVYNPNTPAGCIRKIHGVDRLEYVEAFLEDNLLLIKNGIAINAILNK